MPPSGHPQDTAAVAAKPLSRKRRILIWTLVVLASIIAAVGIMTTWVKRQMLDNAAWNRATTQMVQDPKVQGALATYMVNQLYDNIDVGQALSERLPDTAARAAAVHQREHCRPPEAHQRAREQDRLRHLDRQRRGHAERARDGRRGRHRAGDPVGRAREAAEQGRHDHADEVGPALGGAGRRPGRADAQRLDPRGRVGPLRPRDLPRPRDQAGDPAQRGRRAGARGALRPRHPAPARQLRRQFARHPGQQARVPRSSARSAELRFSTALSRRSERSSPGPPRRRSGSARGSLRS